MCTQSCFLFFVTFSSWKMCPIVTSIFISHNLSHGRLLRIVMLGITGSASRAVYDPSCYVEGILLLNYGLYSDLSWRR